MGFSEGDQYFVCGVAEHCREGNMKLHVRVSHHCSSPPPPPPSSCECGGGWTWPRVTTPSPLNPPRNVDWKLDMSDQESNICVRPGETLSIGSSVLKMNVLCIFFSFSYNVWNLLQVLQYSSIMFLVEVITLWRRWSRQIIMLVRWLGPVSFKYVKW